MPSQFQAITSLDIAGAFGFSRLSKFQSSLLRLKWSKDQSSHSTVIASLYMSLDIEKAMQYPKYRPNLIWEICESAISDFCHHPVCQSCQGQRYAPETIDGKPTGKIVSCGTCLGSGVKSGKREETAWKLGLTPRDFRRYGWATLYKSLLDTLSNEESSALKSLRFADD